MGYIFYTYGYVLPKTPVGPAPMTPEQVGVTTVQNPRIVSHDGTTATIEVRESNSTATFKASLINTYGNKLGIKADTVCALIDTFDPRFFTAPLWATTAVKNLLGSSTYGVLCTSDTLYTNVGTKQSASTGTPGFISYTNYLGTIDLGGAAGAVGSGKRRDICSGACQ
jgi:hypothetical protein